MSALTLFTCTDDNCEHFQCRRVNDVSREPADWRRRWYATWVPDGQTGGGRYLRTDQQRVTNEDGSLCPSCWQVGEEE